MLQLRVIITIETLVHHAKMTWLSCPHACRVSSPYRICAILSSIFLCGNFTPKVDTLISGMIGCNESPGSTCIFDLQICLEEVSRLVEYKSLFDRPPQEAVNRFFVSLLAWKEIDLKNPEASKLSLQACHLSFPGPGRYSVIGTLTDVSHCISLIPYALRKPLQIEVA